MLSCGPGNGGNLREEELEERESGFHGEGWERLFVRSIRGGCATCRLRERGLCGQADPTLITKESRTSVRSPNESSETTYDSQKYYPEPRKQAQAHAHLACERRSYERGSQCSVR